MEAHPIMKAPGRRLLIDKLEQPIYGRLRVNRTKHWQSNNVFQGPFGSKMGVNIRKDGTPIFSLLSTGT